MKKYFIALFLIGSLCFGQSDNIDVTLTNVLYHNFTLTTAIDTADIKFTNAYNKGYTETSLVVKSDGVDTLNVYTLSADETQWTQVGVLGLADDTVRTNIISTTTAKEYWLLDSQPKKIRIISTSNDGSTSTVIASVKKRGF